MQCSCSFEYCDRYDYMGILLNTATEHVLHKLPLVHVKYREFTQNTHLVQDHGVLTLQK